VASGGYFDNLAPAVPGFHPVNLPLRPGFHCGIRLDAGRDASRMCAARKGKNKSRRQQSTQKHSHCNLPEISKTSRISKNM
jgi:hypothetical protein